MYSRIKVFGHPVHPMLVSYPIACYLGTLVGFSTYAAIGGRIWLRLAIAMNIAGVGTAVIAAIPGFIDWAFGIPRGTRAKAVGLRHLGFNLFALVLFAVNLIVYASHWNGPFKINAAIPVILTAVGFLSTVAAGFHGWTLVQDHHVGVNLTPEQEAIERSAETTLRRAS
jgi:uncharacterized membrane protein